MPLNSGPTQLLNKVLDLDRTRTPDRAMADEATDLIERAAQGVMSDAFSGVLWMYPAAVSLVPRPADSRAVSSSLPHTGQSTVSTSAALPVTPSTPPKW